VLPAPDPVEAINLERDWTVVERARHEDRPQAMYYIERLAGDFIPLQGDAPVSMALR
jgi:acetyl-CoA carboxylase alpha subunit